MGMIRVALAVAVLLSHLPMAEFKFLSGGLAVQSFFIISGFYMSLVLSTKYADIGMFYSNRLLRLYPGYLAMLALGAFTLLGLDASATANPALIGSILRNPVSFAVMAFENIAIVGQELLFWFTIDGDGALHLDTNGVVPSEQVSVAWQGLMAPQSWSLSMELMFYAIAPFLVRLRWRWLAALALASIGLRLAGHWLDVDYLLWQGRFFPTALFMFLLGMLGHRCLPLVERAPKAVGWIMAFALLGYIIGYSLLPLESLTARWLTYAVVACATPWIFHAFKSVAIDRWIGELSYPVYLSQLIVIGVVLKYEPPLPMWTAIAATFAISAAVMVLIEQPIDRWRQRRLERARMHRPSGEFGSVARPPASVSP